MSQATERLRARIAILIADVRVAERVRRRLASRALDRETGADTPQPPCIGFGPQAHRRGLAHRSEAASFTPDRAAPAQEAANDRFQRHAV